MDPTHIKLIQAEIGADIKKAFINFKKDGVSRKTPEYKQKKYAELKKLRENWTINDEEIRKLDQTQDECYDKLRNATELIYTEYYDELMAIPGNLEPGDPEPGDPKPGNLKPGGEGDDPETNIPNKILVEIQQQFIRYETVKKIIEEVDEKIDEEEELSTSYCRMRINKLNDCWQRMSTAHEDIMVSKYPQHYLFMMNRCEEAVDKILLILEETQSIKNTKDGEGIKLERTSIPKFSGDYFKWIAFRDLFVSLVINKRSIPKAQKLQLLKTYVGGEVENLIADLTISDANFEDAWQRIVQRYENKKVVVQRYITKLMVQPIAKPEAASVKKLLDTSDQLLLSLKNLGCPTESWDDWVIVLITQKLNEESRKEWERKIGDSNELPKWTQLKKFLEEEVRMMEGILHQQKRQGSNLPASKSNGENVKSYQVSVEKKECPSCDKHHEIQNCPSLKKKTSPERWLIVKEKKLCWQCLKQHNRPYCKNEKPCKHCEKNHHTWLHYERKVNTVSSNYSKITPMEQNDQQKKTDWVEMVEEEENLKNLSANHSSTLKTDNGQILLATAMITTNDRYGRKIMLRALIDSGSQGSMVTETIANILQVKLNTKGLKISPLGGGRATTAKSINLVIKPRFDSSYEYEIECFILKKLTKSLPNEEIHTHDWNYIRNLQLADPTFNKVGPIDVLLGAEVVSDIIKGGLLRGAKGQAMAQETTLGWIISGRVDPTYPKLPLRCLVSTQQQDELDLKQFWELEDLHPSRNLTQDEEWCETFYKETYVKNDDGTYSVKIPFKEGSCGPENLGSSRGQCMARFIQLERKLENDTDLKREYFRVMDEYISLGHMVKVTDEPSHEKLYFIPHHAVIKPDHLTTKTRIVFDASAKTTSGWSLNDCMFIGGKQQNDMTNILIKWRRHKIVFKADIEKMYRQIRLDKNDQKYHTILWREKSTEPINEYQLTTITFGTAAAPYLATRTLKQIALECQETDPIISEIIQEDFYVDDLVSGGDSIKQCLQVTKELIGTLQSAGLNLRKWSSNNQAVLEELPDAMTERSIQVFTDDSSKALGLRWNPLTDEFSFKVTWSPKDGEVTKRQLLSEASKLFDPLGWLAPVMVKAKLMMQKVWITKTNWDEKVSTEIENEWKQFREELPILGNLHIPRWIKYELKSEITLHGFCDASEKAYAAVIYTRTRIGEEVSINIVAAKTRVSPISTKTTLPRLELCGAVLLTKMMKTTKEALHLGEIKSYAWSDSMITLGWLKKSPAKWKTFVANRVAEVQDGKIGKWDYVKSEDNPADCASRGIMPSELENHPLWWTGPPWLKGEADCWPQTEIQDHNMEEKGVSVNVATINWNEEIERSSSWFKLVRSTAFCLRWKSRNHGGLTNEELDKARTILLKRCQQECFPGEITKLLNEQPISKKSHLLSLNPFLDEKGLLRVGGRLNKAIMSFNNKHPIILPSNHHVTKLIVRQMHLDTLHGGPLLMTGSLRKLYWILQIKRVTKNEYNQCVKCKRFTAQPYQQMMGNLPQERITLERAFLHIGLDYAGPIEVRSSRLRNAKILKGYIAIFVCLATKAIHLELVSDMTTEAFLAALQRFMARRGLCATIYCDNGTNFVGGANKLDKKWLGEKNLEMKNKTSNRGIEWKFNPPGSPNFGGIYERGVRSCKDHLNRTLKTVRLTFEEYGTLLCQIEACLNSRPLGPLTNDQENLNALTPGHFLIGEALLAPPQGQLLDTTANKINRWKQLQVLQQHFWKRWQSEYLNQLQQRHKWKSSQPNLKKGDMVLVKDEQLPPKQWLMGRITEVYPGADGMVRVASIKTMDGIIKRPTRKLCPLLEIDENDEAAPMNEREKDDSKNEKKTTVPILTTKGTPNRRFNNQVVKTKLNPVKYDLRPKLGTTRNMLLFVIGVLFLIGGGLAEQINPITTEELNQNSGIYFEDLGRSRIIRTYWTLALRCNLSTYRYELKNLEESVNNLTKLCRSIATPDNHCKDTIAVLHENLAEIKRLNVLLKANKESPGVSRNKRSVSPLNIVGWATHELFGVMDANQAEDIENHFTKMEQNEMHVLNLLRNQISLVDTTVNLMKATHDEINQNYLRIDSMISTLANSSNLDHKKEQITGWAIYLVLLVRRFEKMQQTIIDMVTDAQQGHLNPTFFSPDQLRTQLEIMNNNLPSGNRLPADPQNDIKIFYGLIKGRTRVTEMNIIMDLTIPLVSNMEFQLIHVIPIPMKQKDHQISIIPDEKILMITLQRDNFYQVSMEEYHTCLKTKPTNFICHISHPMYNAQSNKSKCERELLAHRTEFSKTCRINVTKDEEFWIPLEEANNWIYGLKGELTVNVICGNELRTIAIRGTGLMKIRPGCGLNRNQMTITAESNKLSNGDYNFNPTLNLVNTAITSGSVSNWSQLHLTLNHDEQFDVIHKQLSQLKEDSKLTFVHHTTHYGTNVGIILLITIISTFVSWKNRHKIRQMITPQSDQMSTELQDVEIEQHGAQLSDKVYTHPIAKTRSQLTQDDDNETSTAKRHQAGECSLGRSKHPNCAYLGE